MRSGHVEYGDGVPRQLAALWVDDVTTAPPWWADTDDPIHDHPIADVLFGVARFVTKCQITTFALLPI